MRNLINAAPIGIYLINTDGIIIDFWNAAAEEIFGYSHEETLGHFIPSIDDEELRDYEQLMERIKKGEKLSGHRVVRKRKDGQEIIVELNTSPIYKDGELHEILVLTQDVTELIKKENKLMDALDDKNILIQEIHHRVKNNLAIISGLLELQIMRGEAAPQLADTKNRIHSIAAVHEHTYESSSFSRIDAQSYIQSLIKKSKYTIPERPERIEVDFENNIDTLNINEAIPLGLLLTELMTNSIKHAFNGDNGNIIIRLNSVSSRAVDFSYTDTGRGFNQSKFNNGKSFGLELIKTLISQLTKKYEVETKDGFKLRFQFNRKERGPYANLN